MKNIEASLLCKGEKPTWDNIVSDLHEMKIDFTADAEALLIDIIHSKDPLWLNEASELPHAMSPEDTLKSVAVQILIANTGSKHNESILKLYNNNFFSVILKSIISSCLGVG